MTIEEKAKRYEEAIERAKELLDHGLKDTRDKRVVLSFFPELRESEDERIRKELLSFCQNRADNYPNDPKYANISNWIAWLEKQGEEKTVNYPIEGMFPYTDPADTLDGEIENIWNKLRNCDNTFTAAKSGFYEVIHHFANWLEKQGEQKSVSKEYTFKSIPRLLDMIEPTDRSKLYCKKLIDSLLQEGYATDAKIVSDCLKQMNGEKVAMATMDNQKPSDNVEPKFKVKYAGSEYNVFETKDIAGVTFYGIEDEPNHIDYVKAENCYIINGYAIKENGSPYPTKPAVFSEQKSTDKQKFEIGDEIKTDNKDPLTITKINEQGYWSGDLFICSFEDSAKWELVGKRINKLEHKFHKGDWIIHQGTENIYQVVACIDNQYQLRYGDNYTVQKCTNVDRCSRLWDISDAKDGDVLYSLDSKQPFIFKHRNPNEQAEVYCGINIYGKFFVWNTKDCIITTDKYVPATKEQRDTLERAITNAGYRWDKETYELKKISQRMVSAEAKEALYDKPTDEEMKELLRTEYEKGKADGIAEMKKHIDIMDKDNIDDFAYQCAYDLSKDWLYENASWDDVQIACKLGAKWYEAHHKVQWSEEDERMIDNIIFELEENQENISGVGYKIDWLKQLKQRIGWKPSDEQMKAFEHFVRSIGESGYASPYENNTKLMYSLLNDLKKLTE